MRYLAITVLLLATTGCYGERVDNLEKKVDWVYEIVRQRRLSVDKCEDYSMEGFMDCVIAPDGKCNCVMVPDEQDKSNTLELAAIALRASQIKAEEEAAKENNDGEASEESRTE